MNIRTIRENLGRSKTCCQRREFQQGLFLVISALRDLGGLRAPTDIRQDFRDAISMVCSASEFKTLRPTPIIYTAGKERDILAQLIKIYQMYVNSKNSETYEEAAARKLKIDHALRNGKNCLSRGNLQDADRCFGEAIQNYRDEIALFSVIAKEYMALKEYGRALGYLREGVKRAPKDTNLLRLADECLRLRQDATMAR